MDWTLRKENAQQHEDNSKSKVFIRRKTELRTSSFGLLWKKENWIRNLKFFLMYLKVMKIKELIVAHVWVLR